MPAIEAYRALRRANPSPYLFYLDFGTYQLFGASPEVHVKVREGRAIVRPIAGTRRRGTDSAEDLGLEKELLGDEKERAEHLMLVDLGRNDLGRVCKPGTVQVTDLMVIERYSRVMHIVSQVEGEMEEGKTGVDALRATFPAGTVSGAPKIQAIKTIDRLEPVQRRFYSGVVGYVEPGGDLDTCIAIRSGLYKDGILNLQAGGGIVYDSTPERELEETNEKMSALLRAIGAGE
jgi:anthranilate synthase component 1